eukprot:scaffold39107_cov20-Tisochrysis_lutea.AAC.1
MSHAPSVAPSTTICVQVQASTPHHPSCVPHPHLHSTPPFACRCRITPRIIPRRPGFRAHSTNGRPWAAAAPARRQSAGGAPGTAPRGASTAGRGSSRGHGGGAGAAAAVGNGVVRSTSQPARGRRGGGGAGSARQPQRAQGGSDSETTWTDEVSASEASSSS